MPAYVVNVYEMEIEIEYVAVQGGSEKSPPNIAAGAEGDGRAAAVAVEGDGRASATGAEGDGRAAATGIEQSDDFALVIIPDTQNMIREFDGGTKEMFLAMSQWAIDNRALRNVRAVLHVGDMVNRWDDSGQWDNVEFAMAPITGSDLPWVVGIGNHDNGIFPLVDDSIQYNSRFGTSFFSNDDWYVSSVSSLQVPNTPNNDNFAIVFEGGGYKFLVLGVGNSDVDVQANVLAWIEDVIALFPNHMIITLQHNQIGSNDLRNTFGNTIWDAVSAHENAFLWISGHLDSPIVITEVSVPGTTTHTIQQDFQGEPLGGGGFMRIYNFRPSRNEIYVETYSPFQDTSLTDSANQFTLAWFPTEASIGGQRNAAAGTEGDGRASATGTEGDGRAAA